MTMTLQQAESELTHMKFDSMTEQKILAHWREHQPKLVEDLLTKGILRKMLTAKADAVFDLQRVLEKTEKLGPTLARMEAWNRLMRPEDDAAQEAAAWGMTVENYRNRN